MIYTIQNYKQILKKFLSPLRHVNI